MTHIRATKKNLYQGTIDEDGNRIVTVNGQPLLPRFDLRKHTIDPSDCFNWGYCGSGPAQLALAILAWEYDGDFALQHYQLFKEAVISRCHQDHSFDITGAEIRELFSTPIFQYP